MLAAGAPYAQWAGHGRQDLHTSAPVWAGQSVLDGIDWVPNFWVWGAGHGTMPATPGFSDTVFGTGGVTDHDRYLASGTQSLGNIVRIVLGRGSLVNGPDLPAGANTPLRGVA